MPVYEHVAVPGAVGKKLYAITERRFQNRVCKIAGFSPQLEKFYVNLSKSLPWFLNHSSRASWTILVFRPWGMRPILLATARR